jgi:HEAT repeat protein
LAGAFASEKDLETRMVILQSLGESKDLSAVPPLLKMLEQLALREDTLALREAVIEVLGKIGSREALPILIKILSHWSPFKRDLVLKEKQKAALALGRLGGESAMQALARYARGGSDPLSQTCTAVLEALLKNDGKPVDNLEGMAK